MSEAPRYPKHVFWSDEDDGFIAIAPDLPGSSAFGESEAEALAELDQAIDAWIEAAHAAGNAIPAASRPASASLPSGKVLVRMPKGLHQRAAQCAEREAVSLNQFIVACVAEAVGGRSRAPVRAELQIGAEPVDLPHDAGMWFQQQTLSTAHGIVAGPIWAIVANSSAMEVHSGTGGGILGIQDRNWRTFPGTVEVTSAGIKQDRVWRLVEAKLGRSHARG